MSDLKVRNHILFNFLRIDWKHFFTRNVLHPSTKLKIIQTNLTYDILFQYLVRTQNICYCLIVFTGKSFQFLIVLVMTVYCFPTILLQIFCFTIACKSTYLFHIFSIALIYSGKNRFFMWGCIRAGKTFCFI